MPNDKSDVFVVRDLGIAAYLMAVTDQRPLEVLPGDVDWRTRYVYPAECRRIAEDYFADRPCPPRTLIRCYRDLRSMGQEARGARSTYRP